MSTCARAIIIVRDRKENKPGITLGGEKQLIARKPSHILHTRRPASRPWVELGTIWRLPAVRHRLISSEPARPIVLDKRNRGIDEAAEMLRTSRNEPIKHGATYVRSVRTCNVRIRSYNKATRGVEEAYAQALA
jgi:hypothetical protein